MAKDRELAAAHHKISSLEKNLQTFEISAEARVEKVLPFLRSARLELARCLFDLGNGRCKRDPLVAFDLWQRGVDIFNQVEHGVCMCERPRACVQASERESSMNAMLMS